MKTLKISTLFIACMAIASISFAQKNTTESIAVNGNCGMCKNNIEKAAKKAGATNADWNADAKMLTVKYNTSSTNAAKIQEAVALVGYDTRDVKATDESYNKLHGCCKYERKEMKKTDNADATVTKTEAACCKKEEGKTASKDAGKEKSCCSDAKH